MRSFIRQYPRALLGSIITFWIIFGFIWTFYGWTDDGMFTQGWKFDTLGHIIFGGGAAFSFLYFFRTHTLHGAFSIFGEEVLATLIIGCVAILAVGWEILEAVWDYFFQPTYFEWIAQAQKSGLDTTIDIVSAVIAASIAMLLYIPVYKYGFQKYYNEDEIERLEHTLEHVVLYHAQAKKERKETVARAIAATVRKKMFRIHSEVP